jgi:leucyl/phenylalanyl-tRNA---protein transferase
VAIPAPGPARIGTLGALTRVPVEPPPSPWLLPSPAGADGEVVGLGADLEPGTLLAAYRTGLFPMPIHRGGDLAWWSPEPRGVIPLDGLRVTRSLQRSCRRLEIRVDTAFEAVMRACADPHRPAGWIDDRFVAAYTRLHELGWAHSVEAWARDDDGGAELAGGLYGIAIGGLFAGESMFHRRTDASKVALVALVELLREGGATLLDVQWRTAHLATLGVIEIPRATYLARLAEALARPLPPVFDQPTS